MPVQHNFPRMMLRLKMRESATLHSRETREGFADTAREIQSQKGSREAVDYLVRELGLEMSSEQDEDYFAEALNFHLGLLEGYGGRPEAMAEHIGNSRTMPGPEDDHLYSDHVTVSMVTREHQQRAIERGIPSILFACMPRSASATLTHSLAHLLDVPVLHATIGKFPDYFVAPSWLNMFLEGGAVNQDHLALNDFNRGVLAIRGPRDVFVLIRDPRAAARSQVHWFARGGYAGPLSLEDRIERECCDSFIPWLDAWIEGAKDSTLPLRIHMITFQDIVSDLPGVVRRIAQTLEGEYPAMAAYAQSSAVEEIRVHFNQGDDDAWRSEVGDETRAKLWDACSAEVRELLRLTP